MDINSEELLSQYVPSRQTVATFCPIHSIPIGSFNYRYYKSKTERKAGFVRIGFSKIQSPLDKLMGGTPHAIKKWDFNNEKPESFG
jgi:hypothetical protein